jgi:membrane protease YdiL (CAAX protease family)
MIGTGWGLWHVPLFFLRGTGQHDMGLLSLQGLLFFVSLFPLSYTFLFVSERLRGGVWAAVLLHASWNLGDALMPSSGDRGALLETGLIVAVAVGTALVWSSTRVTLRSGGR